MALKVDNKTPKMFHCKCLFSGLILLVAAVGLTGCAARTYSNGKTVYSIDQAALLGKKVSEFRLPDGSEASVRLHQGHYSVKFEKFSNVFDIGDASRVEFKSSMQVDDFSVVLLEKTEKACPNMIMLLAVRGPEVRVWDVGSCQTNPKITVSPSMVTLDVINGNTVTRNQFSGGALRYFNIPYQQYAQPALPRKDNIYNQEVGKQGESDNRNVPKATDNGVTTSQRARSSEQKVTQSSEAKTATYRTKQQPVISTEIPVFEAKERAPKTIYLDKK